jgi:DNA-binding transcriptional regulator/RsmH inhibitor MraZ
LDQIGTVSTVLPARQPLGTSTVSIDANGRMKLPSKIKEWLDKFPEKTIFCTSLDSRIVQLYPIPVWDRYQSWLDQSDDRARARRVTFRANELGQEMDFDGQGRLTIHQGLRNALGIQGAQELKISVDRGVVQIMTAKVYDEIRREGDGDPVGDVRALEDAGMGKGI